MNISVYSLITTTLVHTYTDNHIFMIKFVILMTPTPFYISSYPCYTTSHMISGRKQMNVIVRHGLKCLHYRHTGCLSTMNLDNILLPWNVKQWHTDSMTSVLSSNIWNIVTKGVRFDVFLLVLLKVKETRKDQIWNFHTCVLMVF